ncbi:hypothetical protein A3B84_00955 [Candidatus Nomurabacteria bacterium RIFCSPHIGHO2_02_FULL_35_13]|uniref:Transposase IS200-like domain-containing protein n=1 Tax=Candidatus Nomurabacteria bacterium RIFCSPHIGHO2_02_FULL_35_13 TaxID=1801748 RepID=A0A1F6VPC8_9BACT|nr:MAG: hypothetical protein A3B84_00955 [Candidatus Nomurabacteria bacterium RIFCSPHIGHO2_02_FULL_35_13]
MNKQKIFLDESDYIRFLFCLLYFQSNTTFNNLGFYTSYFRKNKKFNLSSNTLSKIISNRSVELINFCLMSNHFHITIFETNKKGIAMYMQRVLNSYTKYFNAKYKRTGHLFQGPYQAVHVEDNEQLLHLSAYIHKNPKEIKNVNNKKLIKYPWSSFQDYILENRWPEFLKPNIILEQFNNKAKYVDFVNTSLAKEEK